MQEPTVGVIGEAVLDFTEVGPAPLTFRGFPGGSPLNVAVAAARQGQPATVLTQFSTDLFGDALIAHLHANGVRTDLAARSADPTALAFVSHDAEGNALFQFVANGSADKTWDPHPRPVLPDSVRFLQVSSLTLFHEPARSAVLDVVRASAGRVTVLFDPTYRPALIPSVEAFWAVLAELLPHVHLLKPSDQDLRFLAPDRDPEELAQEWADHAVPAVVLTLGEKGAVLFRKGCQPVRVPAPTVDVVDTVGAGDTFTGSLFAGLIEAGHRRPTDVSTHTDSVWTSVLRRATIAAAINCTRHGADPPTSAELEAASTGEA